VRWRIALVAVLLVGAACSSSSKHATQRSTTTTTASTTTTTAASTTTTAFGGGTVPVQLPATAKATASMAALRVAGQGTFDRVVIEFAGTGLPGVRVDYDDHPTADGSGAPVTVAGTTTLKVRLEPATSIDYTGPARVRGDTTVVTEVVRGGDFEAVLTWFIGLQARAPFRVLALQNPSRIVIDVARPTG
jgi:hypothetical protein